MELEEELVQSELEACFIEAAEETPAVIPEASTPIPWFCAQCTTRGRSHIRDGIPCQDKTSALYEQGVYAFALADGAGSAPLSHFGAERVTQEVCKQLCANFDRWYTEESAFLVKKQLIEYLLEQLSQLMEEHQCEMNSLSSTLLAVAVSGDRCLILHIGDGVIGYVVEDEMRVASGPKNGEFANTTFFVTSSRVVEEMVLMKLEHSDIAGFVLMSDGPEASLYSKRQQKLAPVLQRLVYRLGITSSEYMTPVLQQSLDEVIAKQTKDDCSLLLAAKAERTYSDLTAQEQVDYFGLEGEDPETAQEKIQQFVAILDLMHEEASPQKLAESFGYTEREPFETEWLQPLLDCQYIRYETPDCVSCVVGGNCLPLRTEEPMAPEIEPPSDAVPESAADAVVIAEELPAADVQEEAAALDCSSCIPAEAETQLDAQEEPQALSSNNQGESFLLEE